MDPEPQTDLEELSLAILRQDARLAALQLTIAEMLNLEGEQLEAFVERFSIHADIQLRAMAQRVSVRHPHLAARLRNEQKRPE